MGPRPLKHAAVEIDDHEVARPHLRPMQSERREQETIRVTGHQQGQMVVDALVQAEVRSQPIAGGEIDARSGDGIGGCLDGLEIRVHPISPRETLAFRPARDSDTRSAAYIPGLAFLDVCQGVMG